MSQFPTNALPPLLRDAVLAAHEQINIPVEAAATLALTMASYAIQGQYDVRPIWSVTDDTARIPCGIFSLIINPSGGAKSTTFAMFARGLKRAISDAIPDHAEAMQRYNHELAIWIKRGEAIKKDKDIRDERDRLDALCEHDKLKPTAPPDPDAIFGNITTAALLDNLTKCSPSAGIFSPEGGEFLSGHSMSDVNGATEMSAVLSSLWSGETLRKDTKSSGKVQIQDRRFSLCLMVQEAVVSDFLSNPRLRGQGIHARCLMVKVPNFEKADLTFVAPVGSAALDAFNDWTHRMASRPLRRHPDDPYRLSPKVIDWELENNPALAWYNGKTKKLSERYEGQGTEGFINRMLEHMCRIAAVLAIAKGERMITNATTSAAIELTEYFYHQWDSFDLAVVSDTKAAAENSTQSRLEQFFRDHKKVGKTTFTWAELRKGQDSAGNRLAIQPPKSFRNESSAAAKRIIDAMIAENSVVAEEAIGANNRKTLVYRYVG